MRSVLTALLCFAFALSGASAQPAAGGPDRYEPVRLQAGVWDAEVTFFDPTTGAATGTARGVQTNTLLANGHWVVNELKIFGEGGKVTFEGHGTWGWDKIRGEYIDSWVDTNDGEMRIDHGYWRADARTMHWTALQSDGAGRTVNYRMTEVYDGDRRTLTFFQVALQSGRLVRMAEMRFTRRPAAVN